MPLSRLPNEPDPDRAAREAQELQAALASLFPSDYVPACHAERLRSLLGEQAKRRIEGLRLYQPLPLQDEFHRSACRVRVLRGSNRGGKTLPAAVEVARAVTGEDPFGKYPRHDGRWFCVGKDLAHIGQVMYRKLFRAGAFRMIRDQTSGAWRAYRPWEPADRARAEETRPAPPLIPPRMVEKIAWHNKAKSQPALVRLTNGWEISFFSSEGKPPQGSDIDGWWFDEEIVDPDWFPEMSARTLDRHGRGIWSATPQAGTDQLYDLHERAERDRAARRPAVEEFVILLADNPHIPDEDKRSLAADLSEDEARVRIGGEFALLSYKVYPEFSTVRHVVEDIEVPGEWARYMVVDPGHQVCAVLFGAVPPPDRGDHVYLYDELYIRDCHADKFAEAVQQKVIGQCIQAFLIDPNMGLYTEVSTGKNVSQQYSEALRKRQVASVSTGPQFMLASDDVDAGLLAVRAWLRQRPEGPKLRVLKGRLPNFEWEIKRYPRKKVNGIVTDRPDQRKNNHLMDCLRYLALFNPRYLKPPVGKPRASPAVRALKAKRERQNDSGGPGFVRLGPGKGRGDYR